MIEITDKKQCCGCKACGDICPKHSISFKTDEEGIWYPEVNKDTCINCGLCEKVCPILHPDFSDLKHSDNPETYVLQAPSPEDRLASASGAAYTLLARAVFEQGGYVAGHIWDTKDTVKGFVSANAADLDILRGTKYLQSDTEGLYKAVKEALKTGKLVLFSGCPCHNAAMRRFLGKTYDNLVMTDFTCMGIDSPFAFHKYIESLERRYDSKIVFFKAKSKDVGWRHLTNKVVFANGKTYYGINGRDANLQATFLDVLVRPSCYDCKFKGFPRVSDITIGDFWRRNYTYDPLDDNTGTSYIMLHNDKAKTLFERCKPQCNYRPIEFKTILEANKFALQSLPEPKFSRKEFYERIKKEDFSAVVQDYFDRKHQKASAKPKARTVIKTCLKAAIYLRKYPASFFKFIRFNFFSANVQTDWAKGDILIPRNVDFELPKGSQIKVKGICQMDGKDGGIKISLAPGSTLSLDTNIIAASTRVTVRNGASLQIGYRTLIKDCVRISASRGLIIGEFSLLDSHVEVDDNSSDLVYLDNKELGEPNICIGTHALLNKGAIVKGGTTIGDEAIVAEYSVLQGHYTREHYIAGNPAIETNKKLNWKYNFDQKWNYKS